MEGLCGDGTGKIIKLDEKSGKRCQYVDETGWHCSNPAEPDKDFCRVCLKLMDNCGEDTQLPITNSKP